MALRAVVCGRVQPRSLYKFTWCGRQEAIQSNLIFNFINYVTPKFFYHRLILIDCVVCCELVEANLACVLPAARLRCASLSEFVACIRDIKQVYGFLMCRVPNILKTSRERKSRLVIESAKC